MKLLFVHDHIFYGGKNGDIYSAGAFPSYLWSRYLKHFDEIEVIGRFGGEKSNASHNFVLSSHPKVSFTFVPKISSLRGLVINRGKLIRILNKSIKNSDAVIARLPSENGMLALNLARKLNFPVALEVVGCGWDALWNRGGIIAKLYAPVFYIRMRLAVSNAIWVLYVTEFFLQTRYPFYSLANTVGVSNVNISVIDKQVLDTRMNKYSVNNLIGLDKIVIGLIGNYKSKYKGVHVAIAAMATLNDSDHQFELRVLGNGNPKEYDFLIKKRKLIGKIKFYDPLPNGEKVYEWLNDIDIYIQPSLQEGLPRALIEAMSRGCPCAGAKVGGIPELLEKEFIHEPGNGSDLALTISSLLSREDYKNVMQSNFNKSKQYKKILLDAKRDQHYVNYKNSIISN